MRTVTVSRGFGTVARDGRPVLRLTSVEAEDVRQQDGRSDDRRGHDREEHGLIESVAVKPRGDGAAQRGHDARNDDAAPHRFLLGVERETADALVLAAAEERHGRDEQGQSEPGKAESERVSQRLGHRTVPEGSAEPAQYRKESLAYKPILAPGFQTAAA